MTEQASRPDPVIDGSRCQGYDNEPGVIYHAHDLPRCRAQGVAWSPEDRWLCERHLTERAAS